MKKLLSVSLILAMLLILLTGCDELIGTKVFEREGITMNVPSTMVDISTEPEFGQFTFALSNTKHVIFGLEERFSTIEDGENMTLDEYADAVIASNSLDALAIERSGGAYMYFRYESIEDGVTYKYLAGVYKGSNSFWMIQIGCKATDYDETAFFEYLDSVKLA